MLQHTQHIVVPRLWLTDRYFEMIMLLLMTTTMMVCDNEEWLQCIVWVSTVDALL